MTAALKKHGLPFEHWVGLLSTGGAINAIAKGALERVTVALRESGVPFHEWCKIFKTDGAINAIAKGALDKVSIVFISCLQCASGVL